VHLVLNLYKNAVILIATALFVGGSHYIVLIMTFAVGALYFSIWGLVRKAHSCILKRYYDYKYEFVKVFHESLEGAELINVYDVKSEVIAKAKIRYTNLASYKMAANYVNHGQTFLCDIAAMCITALALAFGTEVDMDRKSISGLATSILLLLNLAHVLQDMLDSAVRVETFFRLNIVRSSLCSYLLWRSSP
jgi:ABC-type bacteriocin/lantibiotic exporter with double-glycine peptidase domain